MDRFLSTLVVLACIAPLVCFSEVRTWTDVTGRKVEAKYVTHDEKEVVLELAGGKVATVPLKRLSKEDVAFLGSAGGDDESGDDRDSETVLNWDDPWPDSISFDDDPEIIVVEEDGDRNRFVYTSRHYRFTCDVRLSKSVVSKFADMFEATHEYCRALPLAISGGLKKDGKYDVLLFGSEDEYIKAGGPPSSGGVFISRGNRGMVLVPLESLGVKKVGSGYMRDRDKSDATLVHELTHQLTPREYFVAGARGWFSEGLAEYVAATPYRSGRFKVKGNLDDIREYVVAYGKKEVQGRSLGREINAPALRDYMAMSYEDFSGDEANFNYGFGLLVTAYFLHLDGDGDAGRMKEFLKELRRVGSEGDSLKALDKLLDSRSWDELQEDISKAWGRKGVDIAFREPESDD